MTDDPAVLTGLLLAAFCAGMLLGGQVERARQRTSAIYDALDDRARRALQRIHRQVQS